MAGVVYEQMALIDTSAVIALSDTQDQFHSEAKALFKEEGFVWFTVNVTAHESFTRVRYDRDLGAALGQFDFLRSDRFRLLAFNADDEQEARCLLEKYGDQTLSFHDALCAVVMLRIGIYKIFSFDRDFWTLGFQVVPGRTL